MVFQSSPLLGNVKFTTSCTKIRFDFFTFDSVSTGGLTKKAVENRRWPYKAGGISRKAGFLCIQEAGSHYFSFLWESVASHVELIRHKI